MSEWWTYTLSDFLLFSPVTYWRLFELHNRALWPAHVLAVATGVVLLVLMRTQRPGARRVALVLFAGAWALVGWGFHLERYASINWAATWFGWAFLLEAALLLGATFQDERRPLALRGATYAAGVTLAAFGILVMPFLAPLSGRHWVHAEVFAIAPDPTAIATLGGLLASGGRGRLVLLAVPLAWCAVSGATLVAMQAAGAVVPLAAAVASVAVIIRAPKLTKG